MVGVSFGAVKKYYHCEGSCRLGLTFKSRLFEPLFLATFKVFFTVNKQEHEQCNICMVLCAKNNKRGLFVGEIEHLRRCIYLFNIMCDRLINF
jgi:hypothetical protein